MRQRIQSRELLLTAIGSTVGRVEKAAALNEADKSINAVLKTERNLHPVFWHKSTGRDSVWIILCPLCGMANIVGPNNHY